MKQTARKRSIIREKLNQILWSRDPRDYEVIFIHRGAPGNLKRVRCDRITETAPRHFVIDDDTIVPYHRVVEIRRIKGGETLWRKIRETSK